MRSKTSHSRSDTAEICAWLLTDVRKLGQSTAARSALGTVRESELYGGVLSASLSREHLALTAEFLRGDE